MYRNHHLSDVYGKGVEVTPQMAGLMCAAILSDTLVFRSPTCTQVDKSTALILAEIAQIDVEEFAQKCSRQAVTLLTRQKRKY